MVITGAGSRETIIRQTVDDRVILSNAAPAGLVPGALVTGLTITGGRITQQGNQLGGGVRVEDYLFGIDDVTVRDNKIFRLKPILSGEASPRWDPRPSSCRTAR